MLFRTIDLFGKNYELKSKGYYKQYVGISIFLSCAVYLISVTAFIIFGKELIERKLPSVTQSEEYDMSIKIPISQVPLTISFHRHDGSIIQDIKPILHFEVYMFVFEVGKQTQVLKRDSLIPCKSEFYPEHEKIIKDILGNDTHYCFTPDSNNYISNPYGAINSAFIYLQVSKCDKSCDPQLDSITQEMYARINYVNTYVDTSNLQDSIVYYADSFTQQIGNMLLKRAFFQFTNNYIRTDTGWILENQIIENYIALRQIRNDVNPSLSNQLFWITIESSYLRTKIIRSYMKLQELFAKVGGFFNAIKMISYIISIHYISYRHNKELLGCINDEIIKTNGSIEEVPGVSPYAMIDNSSNVYQQIKSQNLQKTQFSNQPAIHAFNPIEISVKKYKNEILQPYKGYFTYLYLMISCRKSARLMLTQYNKAEKLINSSLSITNVISYYLNRGLSELKT